MTEPGLAVLLASLPVEPPVGVDLDLDLRRAYAVHALTGCRITFANNLERYWKHGEGAAKIRWRTPGDFTRCKRHLTEHVGGERAARICAQWHYDMNGFWPGDKRNT